MARYTLFRIAVLSLWWRHVTSESLSEALKRRSEAFLVYANNFVEDYEPTAFAAVPLSAPIPVVQLLSPAPLPHPGAPRGAPGPAPPAYTRPRPDPYPQAHPYPQADPYPPADRYPQTDPYPRHQPAESVQRQYAIDKYPRPYAADSYGQYAAETYARPYTSHYVVDFTRLYAPQYPGPLAPDSRRPEPAPAAPEVLYARPDPYGGYTYVTKAPNKPPPKKVHKKRAKPVILRIHKYRVIRDDR